MAPSPKSQAQETIERPASLDPLASKLPVLPSRGWGGEAVTGAVGDAPTEHAVPSGSVSVSPSSWLTYLSATRGSTAHADQ